MVELYYNKWSLSFRLLPQHELRFKAPSDLLPLSAIFVKMVTVIYLCILFFKGHKNSGRAPPGKHCGPFLPLLRSGNSFCIHQEGSVEASEAAMIWHHCSAPETELILPFPWGGETQAVFAHDGHSFVLQSRQNGRPLPGARTWRRQPAEPCAS